MRAGATSERASACVRTRAGACVLACSRACMRACVCVCARDAHLRVVLVLPRQQRAAAGTAHWRRHERVGKRHALLGNQLPQVLHDAPRAQHIVEIVDHCGRGDAGVGRRVASGGAARCGAVRRGAARCACACARSLSAQRVGAERGRTRTRLARASSRAPHRASTGRRRTRTGAAEQRQQRAQKRGIACRLAPRRPPPQPAGAPRTH